MIESQEREANTRTVNYLYDEVGNTGKTYFCNYVLAKFGFDRCAVLDNGKSIDLAHLYAGQGIVFFDVTRASGPINYDIIEKIKNGRLCAFKYNSMVKIFKPPVLVIFSNNKPGVSQLSKDRWNIWQITYLGTLCHKSVNDLMVGCVEA